MRSDMWALNLTQIHVTQVDSTTPHPGSGNPPWSTLHFVIIMLSMLMMCFCMFVATIFRPFQRVVIVRPTSARIEGATQEEIDRLPIKRYMKSTEPDAKQEEGEASEMPPFVSDKDESEEELCPICLCDFETGDKVRVLPCQHIYHPECVDNWLVTNKSCPMCKRNIDGSGVTNDDDGAAEEAGSSGDIEMRTFTESTLPQNEFLGNDDDMHEGRRDLSDSGQSAVPSNIADLPFRTAEVDTAVDGECNNATEDAPAHAAESDARPAPSTTTTVLSIV